MLHNKGNTIPYYGEDLSGYATSLAHKCFFDTMVLHRYLKLIIQNKC